ncbi:MAG: hypothetical protein ACT4QC_00380 [Planctomycetaceae bacterium]
MQALFRFPGIQQVLRWSFTLSHGTSPSVATVEIAPQAGAPADVGTLQVLFGAVRIQFPECVVDHALVRRSPTGMVVGLTLLDRRWKWKFGEISGRYNLRAPSGTLDESTAMSPQELATLLLQALGESNFSVVELPNLTRPEIDWSAANPAAELAALCESLGCRIVLDLDNRVALRRAGFGAALPNLPVQRTQSFGFAPQAQPGRLKVVGGPTRFQTKFRLEAVGLDGDGSIRPIDELNYAPAEGWGIEPIYGFPNLPDAGNRARASRSVYRWYRIRCTAPDDDPRAFRLPGEHGPVDALWQVLPLEQGLIDTERGPDEVERAQRPIVEGIFWPYSPDGQNVASTTPYEGAFRINAARGVVEFSEPVVRRNTTTDAYEPAELFLTVAHPLHESDSRHELRFTAERALAGALPGARSQIIRRDELVQTVITRYSSNHSPTSVETNAEELLREADAALAAAQAPFATRETAQIEYAGIIPIAPDGAIQQVVWSGGPEGAVTRAGRRQEFSLAVPAEPERRLAERQHRQTEETRRAARATARLVREER